MSVAFGGKSPLAVLHTSWATKCGGKVKNWKRRFFVLKSDATLSYFKDDESSSAGSPLGVIDLTQAFQVKGPGLCDFNGVIAPPAASRETRLEIDMGQRVFFVFFDNAGDAAAMHAQMLKVAPNTSGREAHADFSNFADMLAKVAQVNNSQVENVLVDDSAA
eukprot:m.322894 g.322894  ORF g.322894 m.322894 type:complete len:162 (-) comp27808_c0_seq1:118-603(-)